MKPLVAAVAVLVALAVSPKLSFADLLLFSSSNTFHGCLDCSRFDSDSVCSRFGNYGSRFSSDSIWSRFGTGNRFNSESPWSRFGTGLKIVDRQGNLYGHLSISLGGSTVHSRLLRRLHDDLDGDLSEIRDAFCR